MHAISEIIVIIMVVIIIISLIGMFYVFSSGLTTSTISSTETSVNNTMAGVMTQIRVVSSSENEIYIRNTGTTELSEISVLVNGEPTNFNFPKAIGREDIGTIRMLDPFNEGDEITIATSRSDTKFFAPESYSINRVFVYDDQDPSTFGGGWGWSPGGWNACCRDSEMKYYGSYSYRVEGDSEAWTSPLPSSVGTSAFVFAYKKQDSNAYFSVYFAVNGYWHQVTDSSTHSYQGWSIPHIADTEWHEVKVIFSEATQGTNGEPMISSEGQITNFEYGPGASNVIWFDYTFFT